MKVKTISVQFSNGLIYNTDGFELEFEESKNTLNETILTVNGGSLSDLIRDLFDKGFNVAPVDIPTSIKTDKHIIRLSKSIDGYLIEYK